MEFHDQELVIGAGYQTKNKGNRCAPNSSPPLPVTLAVLVKEPFSFSLQMYGDIFWAASRRIKDKISCSCTIWRRMMSVCVTATRWCHLAHLVAALGNGMLWARRTKWVAHQDSNPKPTNWDRSVLFASNPRPPPSLTPTAKVL